MTVPSPAANYANPYWRLVPLLAAFSSVAIIDTDDGDTYLHADTVDRLARLIADDAELARLFRAKIWAGDRA